MLILSPGPANITERVRQAMTLPDIGHRDRDFQDLLQETRDLLIQACGAPSDYQAVIIGGSGTSGIESVITSFKGAVNGVLILANGSYGDRAAEVAQVHGVPAKRLDFGWEQRLDADAIRESIESSEFDVVYLIHHETTTGILNPLREVAAIARSAGKRVAVDAVSSVCGEELDLGGWGIDLIIGSANKCIRGVPGAAFVVLSCEFADELKARERVAYYTDLVSHIDSEVVRGETPFTPPIQVLFAFREALRELLDEGTGNRIAGYRRIADILRDGVLKLGLELMLPRDWYSNTMTSLKLPEGKSYDDLWALLKDRGYLIYKGQGYLSSSVFRLGTVGVMSELELQGFLAALSDIVGK